jgi:hypothetical protein
MKVPKAYVGKYVSLQWMDPTFTRVELNELKKGREALSTWQEYGVVHDITDGVVLIIHSAARVAGQPEGTTDEIAYTSIPESLIEKITIFQPMVDGGDSVQVG